MRGAFVSNGRKLKRITAIANCPATPSFLRDNTRVDSNKRGWKDAQKQPFFVVVNGQEKKKYI